MEWSLKTFSQLPIIVKQSELVVTKNHSCSAMSRPVILGDASVSPRFLSSRSIFSQTGLSQRQDLARSDVGRGNKGLISKQVFRRSRRALRG